MEEKKWFSLKSDKVLGPMTPTEARSRIETGELVDALFWSRGRKQWLVKDQFNQEVGIDQENIKKTSPVQVHRLWKIKDGENEVTVQNFNELIDALKSKTSISGTKLWTEGYQEWRDVFDLPNVLDELGVSRRKHPRVPVTGHFVIELQSGIWEAKLTSISEGGCGLSHCYKLVIGDRFKGSIHTPEIPFVIHCTAEVVFLNSTGLVGLRFINISTESKNQIIAYVRNQEDQLEKTVVGASTIKNI